MLSSTTPGRPAITVSKAGCLFAAVMSFLAAASAHAGQLLVAAANSQGDALYQLTRSSSSTPLVSGIAALNSDGAKHGSFDSLVWVPNKTGTLDLVVADSGKRQIVRYSGPNYGVSTTLYSWTDKNHGPTQPDGLSVDASGNLFVVSSSCDDDSTPSLWVLPVNSTGGYGAPILIDRSFGGVWTLKLAETLVAGSTTNHWNTGDLLVLVGDSFDARVMVYSHQAIANVLTNPAKPLNGPTSTAISWFQFLVNVAVPTGMDVWPADASHGPSLLFTTVDGRVLRFDTASSAFTTPFASGIGFGLQRIKTGLFDNTPYAFVAQAQGNGGSILEFGAPPASGANKALASISKGVNSPDGLAVTGSSGSGSASSCVAPNTCDFLGGLITHQISGPGAVNVGGVVLEQSCVVPNDPRVTFPGGVWTCSGATLDVSTLCPGYPRTIIPGSMCGHSGPSGSGFAVVKATANGVDPVDNNSFVKTQVTVSAILPGPLNLTCPQVPVLAWAPRPDLPGIEGTIVEDALTPFFVEMTGFCDDGGANLRGLSMYSLGLALNTAPSGLSGGLPAFVTGKYTNLLSTVSAAAVTSTVGATLQTCIAQSQTDFNNGIAGAVNGFSCAAYQAAVCDAYVRSNLSAFSSNLTGAGGNPNPAGDIDGRLANLFLTINTRVAGNAPNSTWAPANNIPPCVTLSAPATVPSGTKAILSVIANGVPAGMTCSLSSSDHYFNNLPVTPGAAGTNVTTNALTGVGTTFTYDVSCPGGGGSTGMAMASIKVTAAATVAVPNVVGKTLAVAQAAITAAHLTNGTPGYAFSNTVPYGDIISESPVAGTQVASNSPVTLMVSNGPGVPNVFGLALNLAKTAIQNAGFTVGTVGYAPSPTVTPGNVSSESPPAGSAEPGGTPVNLVVAEATVPNVVGQTQTNAVAAITAAHLVASVTTSSSSVASGLVISQSPTSGFAVPGSTVNIVVSSGPAVPNVVADSKSAATAAIQAVPGLTVGTISATTVTHLPVGEVVSQNPAAGVPVTGTVSNPTPVNLVFSGALVPNVVGTVAAPTAENQLTTAGLTVGTITTVVNGTLPQGSVIDESPVAGSIVAGGSAVNLDVSDGPTAAIASFTTSTPTVTVGNAALLSWSSAANSCQLSVDGSTTQTVATSASSTNSFPLLLAGMDKIRLICSGGGGSSKEADVTVNVVVPNPIQSPTASVYSNGVLYVASSGNGQVLSYAYGAPGSNGQFTQLPLQTITQGLAQPVALAADGNGNIYVLDNGNGETTGPSVLVFNSSGQPVGTPIVNLQNISTGLAVDRSGNVYVANETEGTAQITVYSSPLLPTGTPPGPSHLLANWGGDQVNTFCTTGPLASSADGTQILAGVSYGDGCGSGIIAYPVAELTNSDGSLTAGLTIPLPVVPTGISVDTSVGSPNYGYIFASYNNFSGSPQLGVAEFDTSGNPIDLQLIAGQGTPSTPNPALQSASAVTAVDFPSQAPNPSIDGTVVLFVADSTSSTVNVYNAAGVPQQPVATTLYPALYYYTLEPTVSLTAPVNGGTLYGGQNVTYTWSSMGVPYGNVSGSANLDAAPCTLSDNNNPAFSASVAPSGSRTILVPGIYGYTVSISCNYVSADGTTTTTLTPISSVTVNTGG